MVSARERAAGARKRKPGEKPGKFESTPRAARQSGGTTPSAPSSIGGGAETGKIERGGGGTTAPVRQPAPTSGVLTGAATAGGSQQLTPGEREGVGLDQVQQQAEDHNPFHLLNEIGERAKNAGKVVWQSLPFTRGEITVNVENDIIRLGLEKAVNNPLTTAMIGVAGWYLGTAALGVSATTTAKVVSNKAAVEALGKGTLAHNTATVRLLGNKLAAVGFTIGAGWVILKSIESISFGKFQITEALQTLSIARWQAVDSGNDDMVAGLDQLQREILNPEGWDKLLRNIPFATNIEAAARNVEAANANMDVFDTIINNKRAAREQGIEENSTEYWNLIREQQAQMERDLIDYYNDERKKLVAWEVAARNDQLEEEAEFWAAEREKQRKLEEEDRKAIAAFWLEYRKQIQQMQEDSRPSKLNFGLL